MTKQVTFPSLPLPPASSNRMVRWAQDLTRAVTLAHQALSTRINTVGYTVPTPLPALTVAALPQASEHVGALVFVSNASGGAVPAFSDGTNWRRVTDRVVVT